MKPQNNLKYIAVGGGVLLVGIVGTFLADPYLPSAISNTQKGYKTGFAAARALVEQSGVGSVFKSPDDIRVIAGQVTAVQGDAITVHFSATSPFDDPALLDRTVLVGPNTTFTKITVVLNPKNTKTPITNQRAAASISDVKVGSYITATATENVKLLKEFTASEIQIIK